MPLPLTVSCFSKIQIGFTFLVLAHPGSPGKGPLNDLVPGDHCRVQVGAYVHVVIGPWLMTRSSATADGPSDAPSLRSCHLWEQVVQQLELPVTEFPRYSRPMRNKLHASNHELWPSQVWSTSSTVDSAVDLLSLGVSNGEFWTKFQSKIP